MPILKVLLILDLAVICNKAQLKRVTTVPCEIQKINDSNSCDIFNLTT